MDYRAAATRQLNSKQQQQQQQTQQPQKQQQKPALPQTKQQPKQSGRESPRMKSNSSNSRANSSSPTNSNKKSNNNVPSSPLSYAATAKKPTSTGTSGQKQPTPPLVSLVGSCIRLTLVNDNVVEGELFTYDVYSGVIVVSAATTTDTPQKQNQQPPQSAQIHLIKASNVKDLQVLSTTPNEDGQQILPVDQPIQPLDTSIIEARKQRALMQAQQKASRIGVGVSEKAQTIFEALSKTLPCRWSKEKIVVLDEVVIDPPYRVDDCRGVTSSSSTSLLSRVRMVLQGELGRLGHVG